MTAPKSLAADVPVVQSGVVYHAELVQGSEAWHDARCGLLTASEMNLIITPQTLKAASNEKERSHMYELLAQRVTRYVEPSYISDSMLRGIDDEITAVDLYSKRIAPVQRVGFITNDKFGFTIGYSPDATVGDDGLVECKSRVAKYQVQTIIEGKVPAEYLIQLQTGLLVSERKWIDFISYSGGLPMFVIRVFPDKIIHDTIIATATAFETRLAEKMTDYMQGIRNLIPTERNIIQEMYV